MLRSVLIANRGEIACRIIRTARSLGIRTIAVFSDSDASAPHVRLADDTVHIGPSPAAESYLCADKIIEAAKTTGADAIHPGYGFLSENADFAERVTDSGLIWIGPPPSAIRDMGLKDAAKALMSKADVPTTPGYLGEDQSLKALKSEAQAIGYPVLIKAVAGGGGKGMRKVDDAGDFKDALSSCKREARAAFGDDRVLLEKWIKNPRHIEVQIFGDQHGTIVHLFERDCTLQRRHQKVIEEAPAPGMDPVTRDVVCGAAVRAAQAVDYVGAGTVEFIADGSGPLDPDKIYFMEMNTRLQVEHPVTEMITGVDLVEWQFRIASGEAIPRAQSDISINGWAMEARLYAENPATGFLPSTGTLETFSVPEDKIRVDAGVEAGGSVSPFYDPMIAKLITHGATRDAARIQLADACGQVATHPVANNAGFLAKLLREQAFIDAAITTGFIGDHLDRLTKRPTASAAALGAATRRLHDILGTGDLNAAAAVWRSLPGFRLSADPHLQSDVSIDGEIHSVTLENTPTHSAQVFPNEKGVLLVEQGWAYDVRQPVHTRTGNDPAGSGTITSPMPGRIVAVFVKDGETVQEGQKLVTVEAMKMEHALEAPFDGTVTEVAATIDGQIAEGAILLKLDPLDES
ncbi:MAG: acetyl/propionyl/methylcrotonyl-CoA carboxylase subunit alpha [Pseudomonadota bacterium]